MGLFAGGKWVLLDGFLRVFTGFCRVFCLLYWFCLVFMVFYWFLYFFFTFSLFFGFTKVLFGEYFLFFHIFFEAS